MKSVNKFLLRFLLFLIFVIPSVLLLYESYYKLAYFINIKSDKNNTVFIWGDSQIVQGLSLKTISRKSCKYTLSTARHGNGVYDFIAFADFVPKNSICIIEIGDLAILRKKSGDRDMAGISFIGLYQLYENNYKFKDIKRVLMNSKKLKYPFFKHRVYPSKTNYKLIKRLEKRISLLFNKSHGYVCDKIRIYNKGLDILKKKNCRVIFIKFPFHRDLDSIYINSFYHNKLTNFDKKVINMFSIQNNDVDTVYLKPEDVELFYDWTHLNKKGNVLYSNIIGDYLAKDNYNIFITYKWIE